MLRVGRLILALGLLGSIAAVAVPVAASAQSGPAVFSGAGLIEIVPAGDIVGDGNSPVTVHVVAITPEGQPMSGLSLKPSASLGEVEGWTEVQAGVYAFTYTASAVVAPTTATLEVKGRTPSRQTVAKSYKVPVRPPTATGVTLVSNPPQIVLGQDLEGSISIVLGDAAGNVDPSDILVRASVGEVQNLTHLGDGRFSARFVPPRVNFPQLAVLTVLDLRDPSRVHGAVAIPLQGKTDYPVQASPGANVVLRIGGREFGPVQASATGRAAVPVVVPPGVEKATKVEVSAGQTLEDDIDLRVPETRRVSMFPTPRALPADGSTAVPVRLAVFTADGRPDTSATVTFAATGGTVGPARHAGNGVYEALFTPRLSNVAMTAEVSASLNGSSVQADKLEVRLVPARPQTVTLRAVPDRLVSDATALRLFAKVLGPNGQGLDRRELVLSVAGATVKGPVEDLRNGDYRVDFSAAPDSNVDIVTTVLNQPTGNPMRHVLLFPQTDTAPNDGNSATRLTIVTVDEYGYPVPDVDVSLQIETGDGSVQPSVKTNKGGVGQVYYTSGRGAGLVRIRARAGNRTALAAMVQGPASLRGIGVPTSGSSQAMALTQAWEGLVVPLRVLRDGAGQGVVGPTDMAGSQAGALSAIQVRSEPSTAAAGGTITLLIDAKDAEGLGIAGLPFEVLVSQGSASTVTDLGGGAYKATVSLPPTAAGELKVSVASGDTATFSKVMISGVAAGGTGWGATDGTASTDPITAPTDPITGPGPTPDPGSGDSDLLNTRIRASFVTSSYVYEQAPLPDNGPLLPATIAVGGDSGSPALPQGGEIGVRSFFLDYVGADAGFRFTSWALTADAFQGATAPDTIFAVHGDVIGRVPVVVGDNHFWVGARVGYHGSDVLYFTGSFEDARIQYQSLFVSGLGLGAEIGAEVGDLYVHGAIKGRLVGVNRWYGMGIDTHAGYHVTDDVFLDVGFGYADRQVTVLGETSGDELGTLSDRQVLGRFGVGFEF